MHLLLYLKRKLKSALFLFYFLQVRLIKCLPSRKEEGNAVLIIKVDNIGDYILCRNFWSRLKEQHPNQSITFLGNAACKSIAEKLDASFFQQFLWIDFPRFFKNPFYAFKLFYKLHQLKFETIVQPTLSRSWGDLFLLAANAEVKTGSRTDHLTMSPAIEKISNTFYSHLLPLHQEYLFDLLWYQKFFSTIYHTDFPISLPSFTSEKQNTITLFIGASQSYRLWDIQHFIEVMEWLLQHTNFLIHVLGGPKEVPLSQKIQEHFFSSKVQNRIINLVAKQSLPELFETIAASQLLISNDTLAPHMAACTHTSFICISNGSSYGRFHPYPETIFNGGTILYPKTFIHTMQNPENYRKYFAKKTNFSINDISPERVIEVLEKKINLLLF